MTLVKPRSTSMAIDVDTIEKIKSSMLEDFRSGEISDVEMSPSAYVRDILAGYEAYRVNCRDLGMKAECPRNFFLNIIATGVV